MEDGDLQMVSEMELLKRVVEIKHNRSGRGWKNLKYLVGNKNW